MQFFFFLENYNQFLSILYFATWVCQKVSDHDTFFLVKRCKDFLFLIKKNWISLKKFLCVGIKWML